MIDDIVDLVSDGADVAELLPEKDKRKDRRQNTASLAFWVFLVIAVVVVFWFVFNA